MKKTRFRRIFTGISPVLLFLFLLVFAPGSGADSSGVMAPQDNPVMTGGGSGKPWKTEWEGVHGRTYLMEWSTDLQNWGYLPVTEEGSGAKSYGGTSSPPRFFTRLLGTDETPDLATAPDWEPPLLLPCGEWAVLARTKAGDPAPGTRLSFFRWSTGQSAAQAVPLLVASTGADGRFTFNPSAFSPTFGPGDRVEVRITGSPNQRVFLPCKPGSITGDSNINPGGNPLGLLEPSGYVNSAPGLIPDWNDGDNPLAGEESPVFRFCDFLTVLTVPEDESSGLNSKHYSLYPVISEKKLKQEITDDGVVVQPAPADLNSETTAFLWNDDTYRSMGFKIFDDSNVPGEQYWESEYELRLSLAFDEIGLIRPVKRHVLVMPDKRIPTFHPAIAGANDPFVFKDGEICDMSLASYPYLQYWDETDLLSYRYHRQLVLGPVPMYVPKSVMGGKPYFYNKLEDIIFNSELPFGGQFQIEFYTYNTETGEKTNSTTHEATITWTATVIGTNNVHAEVTSDTEVGNIGITSNATKCYPACLVRFSPSNPEDPEVKDDFQVKISAKARVPTSSDGTQFTEYELGDFTTEFKYTAAPGDTPASLALRQAAELRGFTGNTPESDGFNGGQRQRTLEPERRIGVDGRPAPAAPTFVDALTGVFHHGETDFSLPIPGSDLSLAVTRSAANSVWSDAFGLRPSEDPLLAFGPGWDSNLTAALVRTRQLLPDGSEPAANPGNPRLLRSNITVRDRMGRPYRFLEYTDGTGTTTYIADPTMIPGRDTESITLSESNGNFTLTQPLLGITHVYEPVSGTPLLVPNNRDTALSGTTSPTGWSACQYHRLSNVTDRFGVTLQYAYPIDSALIPQTIAVAGRPSLQLRILQENGRITDVWDPSGIKHTYSYQNRNLAVNGQPVENHLVLATHQTGPLTSATYGYTLVTEADPRPAPMLVAATNGGAYTIPTRHIALDRVANGCGDTLRIFYQPSEVRSSWSETAGEFYHPAGDPLLVSSITLPGQSSVPFTLQHTLKNGRSASGNLPAVPAVLSILTHVSDTTGAGWTYSFGTPTLYQWTAPSDDAPHLPTASALFFPSLTRTCEAVDHSSINWTYDPAAGFATKHTSSAGRGTSATYQEIRTTQAGGLYTSPVIGISGPSGAFARMHSRHPLPTTTTDILGHITEWHYDSSPGLKKLLPDTITDHRERVIGIFRDSLANTTSVKLSSPENATLAHVSIDYTNTTFPGLPTRITRKAIPGADDPSWVTDLVTNIQPDALGFPAVTGNTAANLLTTITRSPSGRVLSVKAPDGGTRTFTYDSSGILTSTTLEDGAEVLYQHDPAGRTVLTTDPLGHASGLEFDSLGRITKAVRDMDGNLSHNSASGVLTGVDPATDIVSSAAYQNGGSTIQLTDPRGYITVRHIDALGRLTQIITPGNARLPGTVPSAASDFVTTLEYKLLQSPSQPVKIIDPLGYVTHQKFDDYARLESILQQYGTDPQTNTTLFSGTQYTYHPDTGLPETLTTTRTPLDETGLPLESPVLELTTYISRDLLDRPETLIQAYGTDKELQTRTRHTSTGIPWKHETRDTITPAEHWSTRTLACDNLGRPVSLTLPEVTDAHTGIPGQPVYQISYDPTSGRIAQSLDPLNHPTTYGHDICGRPIYQKDPAVTDARSGQTRRPVTIHHYDAVGNLVRSVDPVGYAWNYDHDPAGRLTRATGPVTAPDRDADHRRPVWQYHYDPSGNLLTAVDPEGHSSTRTWYPNNTLQSTTTPVTFTDSTGSPSLVAVTEQYERDSLGRLTRLTDGANQATAFTHDGLGRLLSTTRDPDQPARARTQTTTYDALLPTATTDPAQIEKQFLYDDQFRLQEIQITGSPAESLTFTHDVLGQIINLAPTTPPADTSLGDPSIARSYDPLGRLQSETSNHITTTYGYDLAGQIAKITNSANARQQIIHHDPAGRIDRLTDIHGATLETSFGFDLAGREVLKTLPNNLQQTTTLDPLGRPALQTLRQSGDLAELTHTETGYDLLSNVTCIKEQYATSLNIPDRLIENTYNERGQLLTENQTETGGPLGTATRTRATTHRYDPAENRISSSSTINDPQSTITTSTLERAFTYGDPTNGLNSNQLYQLIETQDSNPTLTTTYEYSPNGNRTSRSVGVPPTSQDIYHYDSFNRLIRQELNTSATPAENDTYHYKYDPLTRRISRSVGVSPTSTNTEQFAFSNSRPAHQWTGAYSPSNAPQDRISLGGPGGLLHTQDAVGNTTYPLHNTRGDITAQIAHNGTLSWHGTYGSDGLLQSQSGPRPDPYGPNGKYQEPGNLANDGYRYRDLTTGTFLTRDPAGFIDGPNDYTYVHHNPWSAWDPDGLSTVIGITPGPVGISDIGYVPSSIGYVTPLVDSSGALHASTINSLVNQEAASYMANASLSERLAYAQNPSRVHSDIIQLMLLDHILDESMSSLPQYIRNEGFITSMDAVFDAHPKMTSFGMIAADISVSLLPLSQPQGEGATDGSNTPVMLIFDTVRLSMNGLIVSFPGQPRTIHESFAQMVNGYNSKYSQSQRMFAETGLIAATILAPEAKAATSRLASEVRNWGQYLTPKMNPLNYRVPLGEVYSGVPRWTYRGPVANTSAYGRVKLGKGSRAEIWERSKASDGKVYDPSGVEIKLGEPWQAGHRPGHKFTDAQQRAASEGWDQDMWKSYQRDPDIYRPERARTNLGHNFEDEWYDLPTPTR